MQKIIRSSRAFVNKMSGFVHDLARSGGALSAYDLILPKIEGETIDRSGGTLSSYTLVLPKIEEKQVSVRSGGALSAYDLILPKIEEKSAASSGEVITGNDACASPPEGRGRMISLLIQGRNPSKMMLSAYCLTRAASSAERTVHASFAPL